MHVGPLLELVEDLPSSLRLRAECDHYRHREGSLCLAGGVLIAHDWKDRGSWFRRVPSSTSYTEWLSPGAKITTFDEVFDSTSALKASASVSIAGKVL